MKELMEINVRKLGQIKVNPKKSYKKHKDNGINQWENFDWLNGRIVMFMFILYLFSYIYLYIFIFMFILLYLYLYIYIYLVIYIYIYFIIYLHIALLIFHIFIGNTNGYDDVINDVNCDKLKSNQLDISIQILEEYISNCMYYLSINLFFYILYIYLSINIFQRYCFPDS
jgi:hypothetical protein